MGCLSDRLFTIDWHCPFNKPDRGFAPPSDFQIKLHSLLLFKAIPVCALGMWLAIVSSGFSLCLLSPLMLCTCFDFLYLSSSTRFTSSFSLPFSPYLLHATDTLCRKDVKFAALCSQFDMPGYGTYLLHVHIWNYLSLGILKKGMTDQFAWLKQAWIN